MANSRSKGSSFELKVCHLIRDNLGYKGLGYNDVKRNIEQVRSGGADIEIPGWSIECKAYQKSGSNSYRPSWWEQCVANCGDKEPVLIYKYNNCPIKCVIRLDVLRPHFSNGKELLCEVDFDTWCFIVREKIK